MGGVRVEILTRHRWGRDEADIGESRGKKERRKKRKKLTTPLSPSHVGPAPLPPAIVS